MQLVKSMIYNLPILILIVGSIPDISVTFSPFPSRRFQSQYGREHGLLMTTLEPPIKRFPFPTSTSTTSPAPSVRPHTHQRRQSPVCPEKLRSDEEIESINVSTLLIDNYDSYTYNVWQLLHQVNGAEPYVVYNDQFNSWEEMIASVPHFDNVVISPGPGTPTCESDFGLCKEAIEKSTVPVLGVCLGHQGIAHIFGLDVTRGKRPVHGEIFPVRHVGGDQSRLFKGIPDGFDVVRYHSLVVKESSQREGENVNIKMNSSPLRFTAWTEDGDVMALEHTHKPIYGVQFHPESVASTFGHQLLLNFKGITLEHMEKHNLWEVASNSASTASSRTISSRVDVKKVKKYFNSTEAQCNEVSYMHVSKVPLSSTTTFEDVFFSLYHNEEDKKDSKCPTGGGSFWLDSSLIDKTKKGPSLSFAGSVSAKQQGTIVEYKLKPSESELIIRSGDGKILTREKNGGNIFDYLEEFTRSSENGGDIVVCDDTCKEKELPFTARRNLFGYIGYEARFEATRKLQGRKEEKAFVNEDGSPDSAQSSSYPTSLYLCPRQFLAYDHDEHAVYIVTASDDETFPEDVSVVRKKILAASVATSSASYEIPDSQEDVTLKAIKSADTYFKDVEKCIESIREGETYEVCMTVQFTGECHHQPSDIYKKLRKNNPAPYSCFISYKSHEIVTEIDEGDQYDFTICCSSPERYLRVSGAGIIDSKPIKGTSRRNKDDPLDDLRIAQNLATDVKSRAENLMIVDLVRNDLGRVCETGSIHVPHLMSVESYATVHQLVSTIEGKLDRGKGYSISDAICATFPGGSMTGAPKLRTMDIIDELEARPRGVYSGTIGYVGSDGSADLNIVIRTAVISKGRITVGAGGAVTALSDPQEEVDEVLLKVNAVAKSIGYRAMFGDT